MTTRAEMKFRPTYNRIQQKGHSARCSLMFSKFWRFQKSRTRLT